MCLTDFHAQQTKLPQSHLRTLYTAWIHSGCSLIPVAWQCVCVCVCVGVRERIIIVIIAIVRINPFFLSLLMSVSSCRAEQWTDYYYKVISWHVRSVIINFPLARFSQRSMRTNTLSSYLLLLSHVCIHTETPLNLINIQMTRNWQCKGPLSVSLKPSQQCSWWQWCGKIPS